MGVGCSVFRVGEWACCVNPVERSVLRAMALAYVAGMGQPVPFYIWETFWGLTTLSRSDRQRFFVDIFFMEEQEDTTSDPPNIIPVYAYTSAAFWLEAVAFFASPDGACLEGCGRWYPA